MSEIIKSFRITAFEILIITIISNVIINGNLIKLIEFIANLYYNDKTGFYFIILHVAVAYLLLSRFKLELHMKISF